MIGCLIEILLYIIYDNEYTSYFCNCCPYSDLRRNEDDLAKPFLNM
jgi:hypothetical protein